MVNISNKEWKRVFVEDINEKIKESKKEHDRYSSSSKVVYLQQAGNKLFSVVENWLMVKYGRRVGSYGELKLLVKNNKNDLDLLVRVSRLHYFFYNNVIVDDVNDIEYEYLEIYKIMKNRVNNLRR
jgi:hypothetical protein